MFSKGSKKPETLKPTPPAKAKRANVSPFRRKDFCDERHGALAKEINEIKDNQKNMQRYIIGGFTFTIVTLVSLIITLIVTRAI